MTDESAWSDSERSDEDLAKDRSRKRSRFDYDSTIQVLVGSEKRSFAIHADVICDKSKFFRAACSQRWKEGQDRVVRLPEVDSETFQRYVDWIYRNALAAESTAIEGVNMAVDLFLLGDLLDDVRLRNATLKALLRYAKVNCLSPGPSKARRIWEKTSPKSPLRRLIVDIIVAGVKLDFFKEKIKQWPADLIQQAAVGLMSQKLAGVDYEFELKASEYLEAEIDD